jgi:hypothetical protein
MSLSSRLKFASPPSVFIISFNQHLTREMAGREVLTPMEQGPFSSDKHYNCKFPDRQDNSKHIPPQNHDSPPLGADRQRYPPISRYIYWPHTVDNKSKHISWSLDSSSLQRFSVACTAHLNGDAHVVCIDGKSPSERHPAHWQARETSPVDRC